MRVTFVELGVCIAGQRPQLGRRQSLPGPNNQVLERPGET